jgi:plastocyanin
VWILVQLGTDEGTMTKRLRTSLITAVALGALASPAAGFAQNNLIATVGTNDSQVITLTHENGAPVNDIPAGTYTIEVRDRSTMHNFHLTGPGVDRETAVGSIQTVTWTVTFENEARYVFVCDPHSTTMRGSFTTGGGPTPPPPPPPPPAVGATLYATVGPRLHDLVPNEARCEDQAAQGRAVHDHRARSLHGAQLPPLRARREQTDPRAPGGEDALDRHVQARRAVSLPL